jgi:hypoxanthine phosphoribosyltransferase
MPSPPVGADLLADRHEIRRGVDRVAAEISAAHPEGITAVGVLKGASVLLADLVRRLSVPCRIEFLAIAPFDGATARTRVVKDLDRSVRGESVVVVSGIVDTGLTADFVLRHLRGSEPASIELATLLDKRARRLLPVTVDHRVIDAPDRFAVGYGLDLRGRYRNLADLWAIDLEAGRPSTPAGTAT